MLNAICEEAQNENITEENKDIIFYRLSAACYGRAFMKLNIEWYKKLINEMEEKNNATVQIGSFANRILH